ncbi:DUF2235 domain-containing protein [Jannaschia sp. W003]|uniref:DUF2235 domain-containing protein n=1 Tax=Jannaschia sp. W003 TaxID=2867012 RepID=UPI0021A87AF0|nr:DUF2235 domain-containing protein [Jannaschia sp. W003]UWQ20385.1 DUF2235 domain-containing protein [Jannaschia sp. W003]
MVLLDGTLSSLEPGHETSVGLIYRMLSAADDASLYYEPGLQWLGWRRAPELMAGVGINRQIKRAYASLARRYVPGDRIYLVGYSRGAYAVRALAGMIDRVGLLRADALNPWTLDRAYEHYRGDPTRAEARSFAARLCHLGTAIEAVAVFDTVRAVGIRWPVLWRLFPKVHAFRSHRLGRHVKRGFHALALNETRQAFRPDLWRTHGARTLTVEQVWFRGAHADVGGQTSGDPRFRPLANVPLRWMLGRLEANGLPLPPDWASRFPADPTGPSVGTWRGFGGWFLARRRRTVGADASERIHPTALPYAPRGAAVPAWEAAAGAEEEAAV